MTLRVGMRCDAGPRTGVGHLIRCMALAEEFQARGVEVTFLGEVAGVPWARRQLAGRGLPLLPPPATPDDLVAAVQAHGYDLVVVDSYVLDPAHSAALRSAAVPVLSIMDGETRGQLADLYVDQNLDAELLAVPLPVGAHRLAGLRYALLRDVVRAARPADPPRAPEALAEAPRVLLFFGGTDAYGAAPVVTRLLPATGRPFRATVVAGRPELAGELSRIEAGPLGAITVVEPSDDLPGLVRSADLVVSASGTSTWELLCLGAAVAVVCVVDNQWLGYDRVVARGLAAGLGGLAELTARGPALDRPDGPTPAGPALASRVPEAATGSGDDARAAAVGILAALLGQPGRRAELAARAWAAVDGRGRERVVDAALGLVRAAPRHPSGRDPSAVVG